MTRHFPSLVACLLFSAACGPRSSDERSAPPPIGLDAYGAQLAATIDPSAQTRAASGSLVRLGPVIVVAADTYDETGDGSSVGNVYVQDPFTAGPYSGLSVRNGVAAARASDLALTLLTVTGRYLEFSGPFATPFASGQYMPQLAFPAFKAMGDAEPVAPTTIAASDLATFSTGLQWLGMLVQVNDVTVAEFARDSKNRVKGPMGETGVNVTNELFNLDETKYAANTKFASITGVVTYFYNFHLAPRAASDLVVGQ